MASSMAFLQPVCDRKRSEMAVAMSRFFIGVFFDKENKI
jgi:hypothetical protein